MRSIGVRLMADVADFNRNIRGASATVHGFVGDLDKAAKAGRLDAVADQAGRMGLVASGAFALVTKAAMDFEKQMSAVSAATHASAADMDRLRDAALAAGKGTQFSATQAAKGVEELAKAGVATADILGGGLKGALDLAAAGQIDVGQAAEVAASAMTQFKLKGSDLPHVADLLAAAAGKAQGDVGQMSQALNQSGLVAAQMGLSVEETTGTLAAFASAGLLGSDAGTSFKTSLLMLANPTDKAAGLMKELGINAYDARGKFVGVSALAGQLQTRLIGLTQEQRNSALATIFGSDAIRAAAILYEQGSQGIDTWIAKTNDSGYAAETAAKKTDNLAGDLERLTGSLQTMAIEAGGGANGGLRTLAQGATAVVDAIGSLPPVLTSGIVVLGGVLGAALLLSAGLIKVKNSTANALTELRNVGPVGAKAADGLQTAGKHAGKAALAFVALEVAGLALKAFTPAAASVDKMSAALDTFVKKGQVTGEMSRVFGDSFEDLAKTATFADKASSGFGKFAASVEGALPLIGSLDELITGESFAGAASDMSALDDAFSQMVVTTKDLPAAGKAWSDILAKQNLDSDQLAKLLPKTAAEMGRLSEAEVRAAQAGVDANGALGDLGAAAQASTAEVKALNDAFGALFGVLMTADELSIKNAESLKAVAKELSSGARSLDENTEAGAKNKQAVLDRLQVINDLRDSELAQTGSVEKANGVYTRNVDALRASMIQAGFTAAEVDGLIGKYRAIPKSANTIVGAPGAKRAATEVHTLAHEIQAMPPGGTVVFNADTSQARAKLSQLKANITALGGTYIGQVPNRAGGVYTPAAAGLLRAEIAPPGTRYQWAEPETGGEAFVPKRGDRDRSLSILSTAASWYDATIVAMRQGGVTAAASGLVNVAPKPVTNTRTGTRLESDQAYLAARDSLASFNTAIKENGRSLSVSTAKGRENRRALYDAIGAAQAAARAKFEETGSVQQANEAYRLHIDRLKGTLTQQKVNASEASKILAAVAGPPKYDTPEAAAPKNSSGNIAFVKDRMAGIEAEQKAREFFDPSWGKPTFSAYTATGRDDLNALFDYLAAAEQAAQARYAQTGNASQATSLYNQSLFTLRGILNKAGMSKAEIDKLFASYGQITLKANRMGGLYEHAQTGLLRDAHIAGAGQTLYAYAEPATGGELFAPKYGNLQKTKEQVGWAVQNWWGGQDPWMPARNVGGTPAGTGGGMTIRVVVDDGAVAGLVNVQVDQAFGALADAQIYATAG